jgi:hypothetical protein
MLHGVWNGLTELFQLRSVEYDAKKNNEQWVGSV